MPGRVFKPAGAIVGPLQPPPEGGGKQRPLQREHKDMTEPPPGKRFQFHLSTAIVMMFVAGVITWRGVGPQGDGFTFEYGWPFPFWSRLGSGYIEFYAFILFFDLVIVVLLLTSAWMFCESLIRRRAEGK